MMPVASCTRIPFSTPFDDCLPCFFMPLVGFMCIFTRFFTCSCMSLACQCVIHALTQWGYKHLIQTYICPLWTPPFVCYLTCLPFTCCLLSCLSAPLLVCLLAYAMPIIAILLVHFVPFCYYLCISPFPLLVYWFLVFAFACTHMERGYMELGWDLLSASKKGVDASLPTWVEQLCSVGSGFSFSLWLCTLLNPFLPPPFLP